MRNGARSPSIFYFYVLLLSVSGFPLFGADVLILQARATGAHAALIDTVRNESERTPEMPSIVIRTLEEDWQEHIHQMKLVVTVGSRAAIEVCKLEPGLPILHALLPRAAYEHLQKEDGHHSAIFLDQPPARRLDLIELALGEGQRIGVLLGNGSVIWETELRELARTRNLTLTTRLIANQKHLARGLKDLLKESDVLLAIPDAVVFNRYTVRNILLTTYHRKVPVVGYSHSYVKAGALMALGSTPDQIGRQIVAVIRQMASNGWDLPEPMYPRYFSLTVNRQVAESFGLSIEALRDIERQLLEKEGVVP